MGLLSSISRSAPTPMSGVVDFLIWAVVAFCLCMSSLLPLLIGGLLVAAGDILEGPADARSLAFLLEAESELMEVLQGTGVVFKLGGFSVFLLVDGDTWRGMGDDIVSLREVLLPTLGDLGPFGITGAALGLLGLGGAWFKRTGGGDLVKAILFFVPSMSSFNPESVLVDLFNEEPRCPSKELADLLVRDIFLTSKDDGSFLDSFLGLENSFRTGSLLVSLMGSFFTSLTGPGLNDSFGCSFFLGFSLNG